MDMTKHEVTEYVSAKGRPADFGFDAFCDMVYSVHPKHRAKANLLMSREMQEHVKTVKDKEGRLGFREPASEEERPTMCGYAIVDPAELDCELKDCHVVFGDWTGIGLRVGGYLISKSD